MAKRPKANWSRLREQLWARCSGRCEVSGTPLDFETFDAHHRRNKGMGGTSRLDTDLLSNLLALDPTVHNGGPGSGHADRNGVSGPRGWLGVEPATGPPGRPPAGPTGGPGSVPAARKGVSGPRGWLVSKLSTEPLDRVPVLIFDEVDV